MCCGSRAHTEGKYNNRCLFEQQSNESRVELQNRVNCYDGMMMGEYLCLARNLWNGEDCTPCEETGICWRSVEGTGQRRQEDTLLGRQEVSTISGKSLGELRMSPHRRNEIGHRAVVRCELLRCVEMRC